MKKTFKNKNYTIANCIFIILINPFIQDQEDQTIRKQLFKVYILFQDINIKKKNKILSAMKQSFMGE